MVHNLLDASFNEFLKITDSKQNELKQQLQISYTNVSQVFSVLYESNSINVLNVLSDFLQSSQAKQLFSAQLPAYQSCLLARSFVCLPDKLTNLFRDELPNFFIKTNYLSFLVDLAVECICKNSLACHLLEIMIRRGLVSFVAASLNTGFFEFLSESAREKLVSVNFLFAPTKFLKPNYVKYIIFLDLEKMKHAVLHVKKDQNLLESMFYYSLDLYSSIDFADTNLVKQLTTFVVYSSRFIDSKNDMDIVARVSANISKFFDSGLSTWGQYLARRVSLLFAADCVFEGAIDPNDPDAKFLDSLLDFKPPSNSLYQVKQVKFPLELVDKSVGETLALCLVTDEFVNAKCIRDILDDIIQAQRKEKIPHCVLQLYECLQATGDAELEAVAADLLRQLIYIDIEDQKIHEERDNAIKTIGIRMPMIFITEMRINFANVSEYVKSEIFLHSASVAYYLAFRRDLKNLNETIVQSQTLPSGFSDPLVCRQFLELYLCTPTAQSISCLGVVLLCISNLTCTIDLVRRAFDYILYQIAKKHTVNGMDKGILLACLGGLKACRGQEREFLLENGNALSIIVEYAKNQHNRKLAGLVLSEIKTILEKKWR